MLFLELPLVVRLALLGLLVIGTVIATTRGLQYGLLLILITGIFEMRGVLIMGSSLPNVTMDRVVLLLVLLVFLLKWKRGEINNQPPDVVEYAMLMLLVVILTSMYVNQTYLAERGSREKLQMGELLTGFAMPFILYAFARRGIFTISQVYAFFVGIGVFSLYLGFTSVCQAVGIEGLVYPKYILDPSLGTHFGRARGVFLNATQNGLAMAMALPILFWLWLKSSGITRWLWLATLVLVGVAIIPTLQRAPWLGAIAALGVMATTSQKRLVLSIGTVIFIAAVGFLAMSDLYLSKLEAKMTEEQTVDFRIHLIKASINMIQAHPLTGIGFNRFQEEVPNYSDLMWELPSHNLPLTIFAELGVLGFAPYILIFTALFVQSLVYYWSQPQYRTVIVLIWSVTVAYGVSLVSVHIANVSYPNVLLFALWGMILATLRQHIGSQAIYQRPRQAVRSFV